ncbi:MAG TPA: FkbM family methyltransferase [Thermoanaerobaculia bacterium]
MPLVLPGPLRRVLPDRLVQPLRRLLWRLPNLRRRLPSGLEVAVESPADWTIYNDVFADGEYDEAICAALDDAPADRPLAVLDLGANVGYFALRLADLAQRRGIDFRITCLEPSRALVRELERRLLPQAALAGRVRLVPGLAGRRGGAGRLFESPHHFEHSALPRDGGRQVAAPYVDLAALTADWPRVDLLKCDIEGAELELLETYAGDLLPRVRRAVVELHHRRCDTARCLELLAAAGFGPPRVLREAYGCSVVLLARPEPAA